MRYKVSFYDKSRKEKVYTLWDASRAVGEVRATRSRAGWSWKCSMCGAVSPNLWVGCEHMKKVGFFLRDRRIEAEDRARTLDAMYPTEPPTPRRRFAPCSD